jgi:hypothetical protein
MTARTGEWGNMSWGQECWSMTAGTEVGTGQPEKTVRIVKPGLRPEQNSYSRTGQLGQDNEGGTPMTGYLR